MQQARSSLLAAHSGSQFLATQAALLQGIYTYNQYLNLRHVLKISNTVHP